MMSDKGLDVPQGWAAVTADEFDLRRKWNKQGIVSEDLLFLTLHNESS